MVDHTEPFYCVFALQDDHNCVIEEQDDTAVHTEDLVHVLQGGQGFFFQRLM